MTSHTGIRKYGPSGLGAVGRIVFVNLYINCMYILQMFVLKTSILLKINDWVIRKSNSNELGTGKLIEIVKYKDSDSGSKEIKLNLCGKDFLVAKLPPISNVKVILGEDLNDRFESRERYLRKTAELTQKQTMKQSLKFLLENKSQF